jgi:hypothetical protein
MYSTPTLATRFARNTRVMRGDQRLNEDQMRAAAPSIFAEGKHASRSEHYTYIPTIDVLRGLRKEGFEPFMVSQTACRAAISGFRSAARPFAPSTATASRMRLTTSATRDRSRPWTSVKRETLISIEACAAC